MQNIFSLSLSRLRLGVWVFLCALLLACPAATAEKLVPVAPGQSAMPMLPHLEWLLDPSGALRVEDLGQIKHQTAFQPLKLDKLPQETGTLWLRFTLAPRPAEVRPATLLLDMGEGVPDTPTLFVPKHNVLSGAVEWQSFTPSQRSVFLMPETRGEPVTSYIRMDGMPGMWFSPMLRTPHNAATAMERLSRPAVIVALGVIMLLCLLRGLTERGEWRIWTSVYTGAALLHAVWGMPATGKGHVDMLNLAAVLAPGVGLMILPHVGRHLMRTRQLSRAMDVQYFLLSLPGAALALLPLLPGFTWTTRYLELWPLGTLLLVPTTLGAWLSGLPGARRFLLGCLLPPLGVAVGIMGMDAGWPAPMLATAPLWGLALGALIIAGTAAPHEHKAQSTVASQSPESLVADDPNLRIVPPTELAGDDATNAACPAGTASSGDAALLLEEKLRVPLDKLLREGAALAQCSLPPAARQLTDVLLESVRDMTAVLAAPHEAIPTLGKKAGSAHPDGIVFDLQELLRQAHDSVSPVADSKNIALSWFMPPHLGQRYRGQAPQLQEVLQLLLESAVRATARGAVQLAVRRMPESVNPGHLIFTVTDTGTGVPPQDRSSLALARAWELAGAQRGFLGVECGPQGATISFTQRFETAAESALEEEAHSDAVPALPHVLVAADSASERQLLVFFLEGLPLRVVEARSAEEAVELYMDYPAQLLIFDGDMPMESLRRSVERVRNYEAVQGTEAAMIMGLSSNDAQWEALGDAGFTHALPKPITRGGLRATLRELLPTLPAEEQLTGNAPQSAQVAAAAPLHAGHTSPSTQGAEAPDVLESLDLLPPHTAITAPTMPLSFEEAASLANEGDDDTVIDTGMPLLNMGRESSIAAPQKPSAAGLLSDQPLAQPVHAPIDGANVLDKPLSLHAEEGPSLLASARSGMPELRQESEALLAEEEPLPSVDTNGLPDILPASMELAQPTHAAESPLVPTVEQHEDTLSAPLSMTAEAAPAQKSALPEENPLAKRTGIHPDMFLVSEEDQMLGAYSAPSLLSRKTSAEAEASAPDALAAIEPTTAPVATKETGETGEAGEAAKAEAAETTPSESSAPVNTEEPALPAMPEEAPTSPSRGHEAYLTSLLDGGDDMLRPDTAPVEAEPKTEAQPEPEVQAEAEVGPVPETVTMPEPMPEAVAEPATFAAQAEIKPTPEASTQPKADPTIVTGKLSFGDKFFTKQPQSAPQDSSEWVGEPQPILPRPLLEDLPPLSTSALSEVPDYLAPKGLHAARAASSRRVVAPAAGFADPDNKSEWVGEPQPMVRQPQMPEASAPLSTEPSPAADQPSLRTAPEVTPTPEVTPAPEVPVPAPTATTQAVQENFVPLSMHDSTPPAEQPEQPDTADQRQGRPSLLPQSTPLLDFIIPDEPAEALRTPPASPPPVAESPVKVEPPVQEKMEQEKPIPAFATPVTAAPAVPGAVPPPQSSTPKTTQATYGSVGEPTPIVRASADSATTPDELPLTQLLDYFDQAVAHARQCYDKKDSDGVREGAIFIAKQADKVGLRTLARMSRCVSEAAKAGDFEAMRNLLPELESTVERNRIALGG